MADVDLIVKRGDDFRVIVTVVNGEVPLDLTDYNVSAQVRATADSADVLAEFSASVTDAAAGIIELILDHTITADLTDGVWDVEIVDTASNDWTSTIASGAVTVEPDVTRAIV